MNKSWTKYGGARGGNEAIYNDKDWYCQSCQGFHTKDDLVFTYRYGGDWLRVCETCAANNCEPLRRRLQSRF